jgi:hypothetical protein
MKMNLSIKKVLCLAVCFVCHINVAQIITTIGTIGKSSMKRGVLNLFHNVLTYNGKMIDYEISFSLKIRLNKNFKI